MARRLRIHAATGDTVTARLAMPPRPLPIGIVLAHGAGAGQDHPWMVTMRDRLAATGHPTLTFDYAYTEAGRKAPDRAERLLAVHAAAVDRMQRYVAALVLAGKSMGGRMASHLVADGGVGAAGLVYFGYPLVPLGRGEPRPTDHLERIDVPQLFVSGTRDRLGPPQLIRSLAAALPDAAVVVVEGGDHSLRLPARAGRNEGDVLAEVAATTADWISRRIDAVPQNGGGGR